MSSAEDTRRPVESDSRNLQSWYFFLLLCTCQRERILSLIVVTRPGVSRTKRHALWHLLHRHHVLHHAIDPVDHCSQMVTMSRHSQKQAVLALKKLTVCPRKRPSPQRPWRPLRLPLGRTLTLPKMTVLSCFVDSCGVYCGASSITASIRFTRNASKKASFRSVAK
jgi:hypothetical protein